MVAINLAFSHQYWVYVIIPIDELIFFRGVAKNHQPDVCFPHVQTLHMDRCRYLSWAIDDVKSSPATEATIKSVTHIHVAGKALLGTLMWKNMEKSSIDGDTMVI